MEKAEIHTIDWVVVLVYLVGIMALGRYFARCQRDTQDFFLGGRQVSGQLNPESPAAGSSLNRPAPGRRAGSVRQGCGDCLDSGQERGRLHRRT